jgi:hypothetical protein
MRSFSAFCLSTALALSGVAGASGDASEKAPTAPAAEAASAIPVFVPPNRGSPMTRLGGATRSAGSGELPRIEALVPEEAGWTVQAQPVLYWYLSKPTETRIDFVLLQVEPMKTLVEKTLPHPQKAGIQRVRLADLGVELAPGVAYQWLVKLIPNPSDRSFDRVAGGGIERVAPSADLEGRLSDPHASRAHALAAAGIWYDAIDDLSTRIDAAPGDRTLWNQRAALFEQVGLPELPLEADAAAAFGRR